MRQDRKAFEEAEAELAEVAEQARPDASACGINMFDR